MSQPISVQDIIQYFTTTTITEKVDFPTEVDYHMYIYLSIP